MGVDVGVGGWVCVCVYACGVSVCLCVCVSVCRCVEWGRAATSICEVCEVRGPDQESQIEAYR